MACDGRMKQLVDVEDDGGLGETQFPLEKPLYVNRLVRKASLYPDQREDESIRGVQRGEDLVLGNDHVSCVGMPAGGRSSPGSSVRSRRRSTTTTAGCS